MYLASVDTDVDLQLSVALADDAPADVVVVVSAPMDVLSYREEAVVRVGEVCIVWTRAVRITRHRVLMGASLKKKSHSHIIN